MTQKTTRDKQKVPTMFSLFPLASTSSFACHINSANDAHVAVEKLISLSWSGKYLRNIHEVSFVSEKTWIKLIEKFSFILRALYEKRLIKIVLRVSKNFLECFTISPLLIVQLTGKLFTAASWFAILLDVNSSTFFWIKRLNWKISENLKISIQIS